MSYLFWSAVFVVTLYSCQEVGPQINLRDNENVIGDTTYVETPVASPESKNVLIEEFTGVRCPNCPQGHVIIANIKAQNPDRVVSVSLHPINSLGAPYPFSVQDFRSQSAQSLFDYLGQIGLEPAAGIDRKVFSGESHLLLEKSKWVNKVNEQLAETPQANLALSASWDSMSRQLTVAAEVHFTQTVATPTKLTIVLTESNITTAQLDGTVIDTFYVHKDVMRTYITALTGDPLAENAEAGRVIRRVYQTTVDAVWKPEQMHLIAFVHEYQNTKTVYQAKEIPLIP